MSHHDDFPEESELLGVEHAPEPPEAPDGATAGTQQGGAEGADLTLLIPLEAAHPSHVSDAFVGIAAHSPRALANAYTAKVLGASLKQSREEGLAARREISMLRTQNDELKEKLSQANTELAVLSVQLGHRSRMDAARTFSGIAGTTLIAASIDLFKAGLRPLAIIVVIIGVAAVLFSAPAMFNLLPGKKNDAR